MKKIMKEMNAEDLTSATGGLIVDDGDGKKYWLVRQNGTVISPVPGLKNAQDFIKAYGEDARVISKEEYRRLYGRDLVW